MYPNKNIKNILKNLH